MTKYMSPIHLSKALQQLDCFKIHKSIDIVGTDRANFLALDSLGFPIPTRLQYMAESSWGHTTIIRQLWWCKSLVNQHSRFKNNPLAACILTANADVGAQV